MKLIPDALNLVVSLASAGAGVVAFFKPALLLPAGAIANSDKFYSQLYAIRALPCGLLFGFAPLLYRSPLVSYALVCAGLIQLADAVIGLRMSNRRMAVGGISAGLIHFWCAFVSF